MTAFVDASVFVAIIGVEADERAQAERIRDATDLITSPMAIWEAITALVRRYRHTPETARNEVMASIEAAMIRIVSIGATEGDLALDAYARFGKGRHRAGLNMGDCFAYACARANSAGLLYKGDDFTHTDLA